ncbi:hypothetical protein BDN70DRAFT_781131, partial [Pholiota conissans]
EIRVLSFNVARSSLLVNVLLEIHRNHFDILFIQEPPWSLIRKTVSSSNRDGDDVIGAPKHPEWIIVAPVTKPDCKPRVLAY